MRILIDECVPRPFKFALAAENLACSTVAEAGFAGKKNGELLRLAEHSFDVFITVDHGFEYQQNLTGMRIAVVVIHSRSNRFADLQPHAKACIEVLRSIQPGGLVRMGA
jgi:predicted nuclease of predicted toxin-antitoxin system